MDTKEARRKLWEERIANWSQSGEKARQWCKDHYCSYTQFCMWRKIFSLAIATPDISPINVSFSELSDPEDIPSGIDILVGNKIIRLHKNFDAATLTTCFRLLILLSLDFDDPGKNRYSFWMKHYPNLRPWPAGRLVFIETPKHKKIKMLLNKKV